MKNMFFVFALLFGSVYAAEPGYVIPEDELEVVASWAENSVVVSKAVPEGQKLFEQLWMKTHIDRIDYDPFFAVFAWSDRNQNAKEVGGVVVSGADVGDVITGASKLLVGVDNSTMRISVERYLGVFPEGPGILCLSAEAPAELTPDAEPTNVEFVRYSHIDRETNELVLSRRAVPFRTSIGKSDFKKAAELSSGTLAAKAWPAGTFVTFVNGWEPIVEGDFDAVTFTFDGKKFKWSIYYPKDSATGYYISDGGEYAIYTYEDGGVWYWGMNTKAAIGNPPGAGGVTARVPRGEFVYPPVNGWTRWNGGGWVSIPGTAIVYEATDFKDDLFRHLDKDLAILNDGRQYLVMLYVSDDVNKTNIYPASYLPLVGPAALKPFPTGITLPGTIVDTRVMLRWRVNRAPE